VPELPEAETIVRTLQPLIQGQKILSADYPGRRVWRSDVPTLSGLSVANVTRYGKQVLIGFNKGHLLVRLGMTGALLVDQAITPYTRAVLTLSHCRLLFEDIRQFGWFEFLNEPPTQLGPDPFDLTAVAFAQRLRLRRTRVKIALLDQQFIRGVGNIYTDEALFRAGIHPNAQTQKLRTARAETLHRELTALLQEAISLRGSSISDYVDASGEKGSFQLRHRVYGKVGEPCPTCGTAISRIVIAQRGTHFCARCQKA